MNPPAPALQGHDRSPEPTGCIVLADGQVFWGRGFGAPGSAVAELCFNTAMTGYQEIMTDPSYAGQVVTFTFPHLGNVGVNPEDDETADPVAAGMAIAHAPDGAFELDELVARARAFRGLEGMDLARDVTCAQSYRWDETRWAWPNGYGRREGPGRRVVAIDYGAKRNILRCLASAGCDVTVLPATATAEDVLAHDPEGLFLSNGPGDPAATGAYAVPMLQEVLATSRMPVFGICLGHQMLALAMGARTIKMNHGHHGANHPVKELATGKVQITSMNHGFTVDSQTLPPDLVETHISLFDGSNCGIAMRGRPVFSVQHHPEASPGPQDSFHLFERFVQSMG
jgi:carbamoyl-phosphate synthase small subunit